MFFSIFFISVHNFHIIFIYYSIKNGLIAQKLQTKLQAKYNKKKINLNKNKRNNFGINFAKINPLDVYLKISCNK